MKYLECRAFSVIGESHIKQKVIMNAIVINVLKGMYRMRRTCINLEEWDQERKVKLKFLKTINILSFEI